jgi:hypothetical protein
MTDTVDKLNYEDREFNYEAKERNQGAGDKG